MPRLPSPPLLPFLALPLAIPAALLLHNNLRYGNYCLPPVPVSITSTYGIPISLQHSPRYTRQINPDRRPMVGSTCCATFARPRSKATGELMGDDEVLRRFTRGFFGGWVFAPERWVLRWVDLKAMNVRLTTEIPSSDEEAESGKDTSATEEGHTAGHGGEGRSVLSVAELDGYLGLNNRTGMERSHGFGADAVGASKPSAFAEQVGAVLFRAFKVADVKINADDGLGRHTQPTTQDQPSYVDIIIGSDDGWIRAIHRVEVYSSSSAAGSPSRGGSIETEQMITLRHSSSALDPRADDDRGATWLWESTLGRVFHYVYARELFANGLQGVLS